MIVVSNSEENSKINWLRHCRNLALIHKAISKGIVEGDFLEVVETMRERGVWFSDEIIDEVKSRFQIPLYKRGNKAAD